MARRHRRHEKRQGLFSRKNLVALFIVAVMVLSTLGFIIGFNTGSVNEYEYNGRVFQRTQNGYQTKIDGEYVLFSQGPDQIDYIPFDPEMVSLLKNAQRIVLTYDENSSFVQDTAYAIFQLNEQFSGLAGLTTVSALSMKNKYGLPVMTCVNATAAQPVIYFRDGMEVTTALDGQCVTVTSDTATGLYSAKELLVYAVLGIIE